MAIDQLPSGAYRARLQVDGRRHQATFYTADEADDWLVLNVTVNKDGTWSCRLTLDSSNFEPWWTWTKTCG